MSTFWLPSVSPGVKIALSIRISENPTRSPPGNGPPKALSVMVSCRYCPDKVESKVTDWRTFLNLASKRLSLVLVIFAIMVSDPLKSVGLSDALIENSVALLPFGLNCGAEYMPKAIRLKSKLVPRSKTKTGAPFCAI